jgi:ATP synthase F1 complex assembly factor 2
VSISEAIVASRLEEVTNIEDWGFVEGGHDIDEADMRVRMAAPSVFIRLLRLSSNR